MAGTSISEMIFFIAAMMISSAVAVTLIGVIENYTENLEDEASLLNGDMRSSLAIINDPSYVIYDPSDSNLTFYLKNTGTMDLSTDSLVVSANGTAAGSDLTWIEIMGGFAAWKPGTTIKVVFRVPGLTEDMDLNGWASTSGLDENGKARGTATDTILFRIKET